MINGPRLKTEPLHYVLSVLFIFEIYIEKKVFYQMVILQSINFGFIWNTTDFITFFSFKTMYEI